MMAEELKPCPFCGEATAYVRTNTSLGTAHVYCKTCQARGPLAEEGTAGWVWNGRTIKDTLRAENERLREALAIFADELAWDLVKSSKGAQLLEWSSPDDRVPWKIAQDALAFDR